MELKLDRAKITGKKQTNPKTITQRKIVLGEFPATAVGNMGAGRADFDGDRAGTAKEGGFGPTPGVAKRVVSTLSGAGKQYLGSAAAAGATLTELGVRDTGADYEQQAYDRARTAYITMVQENNAKPGTWSSRDIESARNVLLESRKKLESRNAQNEARNTEQAAEISKNLWTAADELADAGSKDIARAKTGLGKVGQFAVDAGVAGGQMLADIGIGAVTGGGALIPMAVRGFGSGAQEAKRAGATLDQQVAYGAGSAAVSVLTERLANVAAPLKRAYGAGWLDDVIAKATGKLGASAPGRLAMSALSEAGEEFLEAVAQPVLQRATYDRNARFDMSEALYSALIGAALGAVGGGVELVGGAFAPEATPVNQPKPSTNLSQPAADSVPPPSVAEDDISPRQGESAPARGEPSRQTTEQGTTITEQGAPITEQAAEEAKQTRTENIHTFGGMTHETAESGRNGEEASGGDGQRDAGPRAGGEDGVLGKGAERARERAAEQQRAAGDRQRLANDLRLSPVSSAELGVLRGTDARVTRVIPEEHWDAAMQQTAQRVQRETGKQVTFVVGAIQMRGQDRSVRRVRGVYSGNRIIIQADNLKYTVDQIADHESFHDKATRTPGLVSSIRERIAQEYTKEELDAVLERYVQALRGVIDIPADADQAAEQAAMLELLEEVYADAYAGMNAFGTNAEQFNPAVEQVMTEQGVGRNRETAQATERTTGPPDGLSLPGAERYSFSGPRALRANEAAREQAERMEMQGVDSETIRKETGWFRGADRQWRWEIDDSRMEYDKDGNAEGAVTRQWAMEDMDNAWSDLVAAVTPEQLERVREYVRAVLAHDWALAERLYQPLAKELGQPFTSWVEAREWAMENREKSAGGKLSDYIKHPELFANYPQLRNVSLRFAPMEGDRGYYSPAANEIVINENIRDKGEQTLIHEVQHAIQHIEGFASGANTDYWKQVQEGETPVGANDRKITETRQRIEQTLAALPEDVAEQFRQFSQLEKADGAAALEVADGLGEGPYGEQFNQYFMDTWTLEELEKYNHRRGPNDLYRNTAGEIEARDTAARLRMSEEQRRDTRPDTGDERTVFAERGTDGYSIETIEGEQRDYGLGVMLDTTIFKGVKPRDWGKVLSDYVYQHMAGAELTMYDENGNPETVYLAKTGDRVRKDGAKNSHKVIDKLARYRGDNIRALATVHLSEMLRVSGNETSTDEHSHQWMDENGWIYRTVYVQDKTGNIYVATLNIADGRDRRILYDITNIRQIDRKKATGGVVPSTVTGRGSHANSSSEVNITDDTQTVNEGKSGTLKRVSLPEPERISLPEPERYSVDDSEVEQPKQITIEKWTQERAIEEELGRREAEEYQQLLLRQGGLDALKENDREIRKLRRKLDKLNGKKPPEKQKPQAAPPRKSLPTQAKQDLRQNLLNLFSVPEGKRAQLGAVIDHYADMMLKEGGLTQQIRDAFFERMYAAGVVTVEADPYYQAGRSAVAGGRVYVNEQIKGDFGEDWNDFRKRAFAAGVYLTNDKTHVGVDAWNQELAEILPGMFDKDELDGRTVLERIVQAAEEGKDEKMSLADYTAMLAQQERVTLDEQMDGIERQMDWALRTFAEKARLEIRLRDRTGVKLAQMRADHKQAVERQRTDKELRELQQKTLKQLRWLSKNRNRAPEEMRAAFDEVLSDIDLFAVGAADEMKWDKRYGATWRDLAQMYKDAKQYDPNFLPSKEMERIIARLDDRKIADMDVDALQTLYRAAIGLRTEFYNRKNVIADTRMFEEVFENAKAEIEGAEGGYTGKASDRLFNLEQLTPMNVLRRMAGWNPESAWVSMAKQLEKGERDMRAFTVEANRLLEQFLNEHKEWVKRADGQGKDAIWYEVTVPELAEYHMGHKPIFGATKTVYMTPAQKVHLYLESKNEDNLRHMTGGRTFVDKELYSQGKRQEALGKGCTIRLAPETVKKLVSDMTAEELELARLLERFYNDFSKRRINRVSNVLYGFDKAIGKDYAPIFTNNNYTQSEFGVFDVTAEGIGNLKERQYSKNPSYNLSCFDAFERSVDRTARFVGMAIPARNWQTLLNWQTKNTSMGDIITHKWGEEGKQYIEELVTELQSRNSTQRDTASSTADKLFSKYISAVFGANPSIVMKQLGSIPLASAYLDVRNAPSVAQLRNIDRKLIAAYTQELDYRTMGYSMPETKVLKDNPGLMQSNKVLNFTFGGGAITAMDGWAARTLWPWAENKVSRDFPELEVGTWEQVESGQSPFYQKVAELFNEAVTHTQSVSDISHQSTLRRSTNAFTRALTMFKSDAAQGYNVLRQKIGEAQYYKKSGADEQTVRNAQRKVGGAFLSILAGYTYAQAITFLIALWKNQGKKYKDEDDELTLSGVLREMAFGVAGDMAGLVVGGSELAEIIGSIFTGERWYAIETPGGEQLNDILEELIRAGKGAGQFVRDMADVMKQGGDPMEYLRRHGNDYLGGIKDVAAMAATYLPGLPVNNVEAYLLGLVRWASPELAAAYEDLFATANKSSLSGVKGDALTLRVRHALEKRVGDVEAETAEALAELYEAGYTKAVPTDTPDSVMVGEEEEREELKLDAYQQQLYDLAWRDAIGSKIDELVQSETFREAEDKDRETMLNRLYDYAREKGREAVSDQYEMSSSAKKADEVFATGAGVAEWLELREVGGVDGYLKQFGFGVGATPEQYVQLKENVEAVDDNGSVTQAEAEQAIRQTQELTTDQKAALWQLQNKSWSSKKNPFSPEVGQRIKDAMGAEEEKTKDEDPEWISLPKLGG